MFSAQLSTCLSPRPLHLLCLLCAAHPAYLGDWHAKVHLVGGALNATCQSALAISVSTFTIFHVFGMC
jgi:hypothetical protein